VVESTRRQRLPFSHAHPRSDNATFVSRVTPAQRERSLFDTPTAPKSPTRPITPTAHVAPDVATPEVANIASGERSKAFDLLAAITTLQALERERRPATADEQKTLAKFPGFGPLALRIFPDPVTGQYKDVGWYTYGEKLKSLLTPVEYDSAKRTTFNAFYTSPVVIGAIYAGLERLGVPAQATILEPGCGTGNFLSQAPKDAKFIGVEMDSLSGRIARARHPGHDIRIESFRDTKLPENRIDAVVGNVPFADLRLDHKGHKFALHDFFFAKSVDALKPGGVLALVTSHFTLDKQNAAIREYLADQADFVGAIRLPSDAFQREGTTVVTDILFLRKREPDEPTHHVDPDWLQVGPLVVDEADITVNRYFLNHPEMVLGAWSRKDTLYGGEGYSLTSTGDLTDQLRTAIESLPQFAKPAPTVVEQHEEPPKFSPPPSDQRLSEGSFYVADDRSIRQIEGGQGAPVVYGGTALQSGGTMTGRRLAALIGLRDKARRVLQSQNEGWPEANRNQVRADLNRAYDLFVSAYGPINKTTFSGNQDGTVIRRMPNIVKFREDPDAMLVMSLEDYDEVTGRASKAAILRQDVVGRTPPVTHVDTAEAGLLVSLNRKGIVDLPLIASLYGTTDQQVIDELGALIYRDPDSGVWETADAYLSGNVRDKLARAIDAGPEFSRNVEALRDVQPEDLLPGDIDANLGAPWVPTSDIQAFTAELFGVSPATVRVDHFAKDAVWTLEPGYAAKKSVAATSDFGTDRANGTNLLELALNMRTPAIYDIIDHGDREQQVLNVEATMAAREKQKRIKERFRDWVFAEPERAERLVRIYNDTYNNLRPRTFDGAHLDFEGMNQALSLRPHQKDAVWRGMSSGNSLLAHVVGAGKTFTMAATGMKMRQAGLVKKPMYVVPNHLLEQFAREFMQLYPNARLLVAGKDELSRDKRKLLTAKIASGDWDGIIVTHSSFERIGMSRGYQEQFLREQIAEYDELLIEHAANRGANRNLIKSIEKQKAARAEKLKNLLAQDKKDDGLVFDELGVDHVFIDEAHYFKNLETPTKMDRVAGIQTGGSERAFDMYMKALYLGQQHPGHGVTFATGTPISNTMVEMYTMQRFLDPEGLRSRGIEHFDAWAATFGEVVDTLEISPDGGGLRPRSRFAKFTNLPELQEMFRQFADVQTAEMLNLPRPTLRGGKCEVIACPMSDTQQELQQELVRRYERLRSQKVDPREDNALAITTDGRKLATDARMLVATAPDFPESKINRLVEKVAEVWRESTPVRGTQMIFADIGVNPTPWGYSPYQEIVEKITAHGIPRDQIAAIGDAESDAKKQALFEKVRQGSVRILLGSTQKMGTGTNVQKRLVALHHLDAPWKPAEVEQRDGRILRQGNDNPEVSIYRYVTEGSFDAYMWQALETKARFIGQVITGDNADRRAEDICGQELSYAEVKAIASGNPAVLTLAEADAEIKRLSLLRKTHLDEQFVARRNVKSLPPMIAAQRSRLERLTTDAKTIATHPDIEIGGEPQTRESTLQSLRNLLDNQPLDLAPSTRMIPLGNFQGLRWTLSFHPDSPPEVTLAGATTRTTQISREHQGPRAILNAAERLATSLPVDIATTQQDLHLAETQLCDYGAHLGQPFPLEAYLAELTTARDRLQARLAASPNESSASDIADARPAPESIAREIKALMAEDNLANPIHRPVRNLHRWNTTELSRDR
jgi:N12 class adenine-specific DNA methylase